MNDWGFRKGYRLNESKPIELNLHNGEKIYFNDDEFGQTNKDKVIINQRRFVPKYYKE